MKNKAFFFLHAVTPNQHEYVKIVIPETEIYVDIDKIDSMRHRECSQNQKKHGLNSGKNMDLNVCLIINGGMR